MKSLLVTGKGCNFNLPITHTGDVDAQPLGSSGSGDKTNQEGAGRALKI